MLAETKTRLCKRNVAGYDKVLYYVLNPKSITMDELYGAYDLTTMEWTDGVFSTLMRQACQVGRSLRVRSRIGCCCSCRMKSRMKNG